MIKVQWSLLFYTLENYESELGDPELGPALVQLALATVAQQEVRCSMLNHLMSCNPGEQTTLHNPSYWTGKIGGGWHRQREGT